MNLQPGSAMKTSGTLRKRSTDGRRADLAAGAWMAYTPDFQGVFDGTAELPLGQDLR